MLITCSHCGTSFNIPAASYTPGRKARCSKCGTIFYLPPKEAPASEPLIAPAQMASPAAQAPLPGSASTRDVEVHPAPDGKSLQRAESARSFEDIIAEVGGGEAPKQTVNAVKEEEKAERRIRGGGKKHWGLFILIAILALLLLGLGTFILFHAFDAAPSTQEEILQDRLKSLSLTDMRQVLITNNEKIERIVVIEGKVENRSTTPKSLILLEATLMDRYGQVLAMQQQYCGIKLSLFQLQVLSDDEIRERLSHQSDIALTNTNILPGTSVPFTIAFFNQPPAAYEFKVRIIDVQEGDLVVGQSTSSGGH